MNPKTLYIETDRRKEIDTHRLSHINSLKWGGKNVAAVYYQNTPEPALHLTKEECALFVKVAAKKCQRSPCYWQNLKSKNSPPACVGCRLAQIYRENGGNDLRVMPMPGNPGLGYAVALMGVLLVAGTSITQAGRDVREMKTSFASMEYRAIVAEKKLATFSRSPLPSLKHRSKRAHRKNR